MIPWLMFFTISMVVALAPATSLARGLAWSVALLCLGFSLLLLQVAPLSGGACSAAAMDRWRAAAVPTDGGEDGCYAAEALIDECGRRGGDFGRHRGNAAAKNEQRPEQRFPESGRGR